MYSAVRNALEDCVPLPVTSRCRSRAGTRLICELQMQAQTVALAKVLNSHASSQLRKTEENAKGNGQTRNDSRASNPSTGPVVREVAHYIILVAACRSPGFLIICNSCNTYSSYPCPLPVPKLSSFDSKHTAAGVSACLKRYSLCLRSPEWMLPWYQKGVGSSTGLCTAVNGPQCLGGGGGGGG